MTSNLRLTALFTGKDQINSPNYMESLISQAQAWGFRCECDQYGNWQILPQQPTKRWKLQQTGERWLLLVGNIPQINCQLDEARDFLQRRWSSCFKQKATSF